MSLRARSLAALLLACESAPAAPAPRAGRRLRRHHPRARRCPARRLTRLDDRYLLFTRSGSIPTPDGTYFSYDLDLFDPGTQAYYPIADSVDDWELVPGLGVYYFDARGAEPGLWLYPLPAE